MGYSLRNKENYFLKYHSFFLMYFHLNFLNFKRYYQEYKNCNQTFFLKYPGMIFPWYISGNKDSVKQTIP